ncbi:MAG: MBL fold metallo-hydrolase [Chitinophagaceae bacterium]
MQPITPHLFQITLGAVNCFIIDAGKNGLVLVDTGHMKSRDKIFAAIEKSGRSPKDIKRIILTHTHPDHAGSAADISQETGAIILAHPLDAALAEKGIAGRLPHILSPGVINWLVFRLFIKGKPNQIPAFKTDELLNDGDVLSLAGGIRVIHTPGHSAGHIALYLEDDDILIAGDLCSNMMGLDLSTVYEDRALGMRSIEKAAAIPFSKAVFGHGKALMKDAAKQMLAKFQGK